MSSPTEPTLCACGCGRQPKTPGSRYCRGHHPRRVKKGAESPLWRGGRHQVSGGYYAAAVDRDDPMAVMGWKRGRPGYRQIYVLEHRLVMARYIGRPLFQWETVHHIDGNRANNDLDNLQLRVGRHGAGQVLRCASCGSINLVPHDLEGGGANGIHDRA